MEFQLVKFESSLKEKWAQDTGSTKGKHSLGKWQAKYENVCSLFYFLVPFAFLLFDSCCLPGEASICSSGTDEFRPMISPSSGLSGRPLCVIRLDCRRISNPEPLDPHYKWILMMMDRV
jgi:hypothetical protein